MAVDASNQAQADFWTVAGTLWTALRDRFDNQANEHGLAAIEALAPVAGERVIDIGCGAGTSTVQIADRVGHDGEAIGFDISPTMIDGAFRLPLVMRGKMLLSATRSPSTPITRACGSTTAAGSLTWPYPTGPIWRLNGDRTYSAGSASFAAPHHP